MKSGNIRNQNSAKYKAGTTLYPTKSGNFSTIRQNQPRKDNGQWDTIKHFEYKTKSNPAKDYSKTTFILFGIGLVIMLGMTISTYFETKAIKVELELSKQALMEKNQAFQKMLTERVFRQLISIAQNQLEQSLDVYDLSQNSLDLVENMNQEMRTKLMIKD